MMNIEKLTKEVLLLKLINEALSMQITDLHKNNKDSDDIEGHGR